MPDFSVPGDPGAVRARAATMREQGRVFGDVARSLAEVTTDGWTGRAAERFREKYDAEPERWRQAGDGFTGAAGALDGYAAALEGAQERARWAQQEHTRGEVTAQARAAYDADVSRARGEVAAAEARGVTMTLTIVPFQDPGEQVRAGALRELAAARADLETAAQACAHQVRAGCAAAPERRNWFESGVAAVGSFLGGAGGAVLDLGQMVWNLSPQGQLVHALTSGLTAEELAMQHRLTVEQAGALISAAREDPVGFGKQLGEALLDVDRWEDDPFAAAGALLPDIAATLVSGGAGAGARTLRALDGLHDVSLLSRPLHGLRVLRGAKALELAGLDHLDDAALVQRLGRMTPDEHALLLRRGEDFSPASMADVFGPHRWDTDYSHSTVVRSWKTVPEVDAPTVPVDGPLVNVHGVGDAGSGTYWANPAEMLRLRSEEDALNWLGLRDEWYMDRDSEGTLTYSPRDEITVRHFAHGEEQRMQIGTLGPQKRDDAAWNEKHPSDQGVPPFRPDGTPVPEFRPGGATQYVAGLDQPAYDTPVPAWTGPPPWAAVTPDGAWTGALTAAVAAGATSTVVGAAAEEQP